MRVSSLARASLAEITSHPHHSFLLQAASLPLATSIPFSPDPTLPSVQHLANRTLTICCSLARHGSDCRRRGRPGASLRV